MRLFGEAMFKLKGIQFVALSLAMTLSAAQAAQSIVGYSCEGTTIDIEMEENVSGTPSVSVNGNVISGGTTTTTNADINITGSYSCPETSNVRVTLGDNIHTFLVD